MSRPALLSPDPSGIDAAARLLRNGRLVAFPTETVYGLGADATSDAAVAAIFEAKGRPRFNPLIIHLPDPAAAETLVTMDRQARSLAARFWPGPLTLVLPRRTDCPVSLLAGAGLDTLAVRVPDHPLALDLLTAVGRPLAAPSANRSEQVSPTTVGHVVDSLDGGVDAVLDGGPCRVGLESTVVALGGDGPTLLRPGGLPVEEIETVTGPLRPAGEGDAPSSPGMLRRHYAPARPLRLDARQARRGEALLAFGPDAPADAAASLSPSGDLTEAAANLFALLRTLDQPPHTGIAVMPIPEHGLGRAINDRLRRAAAGGNDG